MCISKEEVHFCVYLKKIYQSGSGCLEVCMIRDVKPQLCFPSTSQEECQGGSPVPLQLPQHSVCECVCRSHTPLGDQDRPRGLTSGPTMLVIACSALYAPNQTYRVKALPLLACHSPFSCPAATPHSSSTITPVLFKLKHCCCPNIKELIPGCVL